MKQLFFITTSVMLFVLFMSCGSNTANGQFNLSAIEFSEKINQMPDAPIIDVRTPEEFEKGHLQNAKNFNWNGNNFENEISTLDKSKPVFVYCLSGGRSSSATNYMRSNGFTQVYELSGGIMKWRGADLPETTEAVAQSSSKVKADELTIDKFNELIKSEKIVLVDFYADWCAPCKKMKPYLEEISKEMADKVEVIRINADDNQQLCKDLKIDALPVLQIYKNKALTWNHSGYIAKEGVVTQLQ